MSTFMGYSMLNCYVDEQYLYYLNHSLRDKGFHAFLNGILMNVTMIAWLEFELTMILQSIMLATSQ